MNHLTAQKWNEKCRRVHRGRSSYYIQSLVRAWDSLYGQRTTNQLRLAQGSFTRKWFQNKKHDASLQRGQARAVKRMLVTDNKMEMEGVVVDLTGN